MDLSESALQELLRLIDKHKELTIKPTHVVFTTEDLSRHWLSYVQRHAPSVQKRLLRLNADRGPPPGQRLRGLPVNSEWDVTDRLERNIITLAEFKRRYGHTNVPFFKHGRRKYVTRTAEIQYKK